MKRKSIFALVFGFGLGAITALATLASCEVGLGSAVDVLTPELAITYPATGTIVKGKFALSGTCSDDGQIDHISTFHQTVRRGVGPTSCDVNTHWRTAPYYLVVGNAELGYLLIIVGIE